MTRLRDDGYLETDDPVCAACFLGEFIVQGLDDFLYAAGMDDVMLLDGYGHQSWTNYPILIPASVVAKVWDNGMAGMKAEVLAWAVDGLKARCGPIDDWLDKHGTEGVKEAT